MAVFTFIHDFLFGYYYFFGWRDAVEVLFFATLVYYFSLFLKKDRQKNLLGYFYAYTGLAFITYQAQLTSINYLLCVTSPIALIVFILIHQNTLQKNFVALRTLVPAHIDTSTDWLDELIRASLVAVNDNKQVRCIIQDKDSLAEFLHTPLALQATVKQELLTILLDSQSYNQQQLIWVTTLGKLVGLNAQWQLPIEMFDTKLDVEQQWRHDALLLTSKTDALVFAITPANRTFDIIVGGKIFEAISTSNAVPFIKKYFAGSSSDYKFKESIHVPQSQKRSDRQRTT